MTRQSWGEEERKRALRAFRRAHAEFRVAVRPTHCPSCLKESAKRRPYCEYHHFAYEGWLTGGKGCAMIMAKALRDQQLKEELKAEGLWYGGD